MRKQVEKTRYICMMLLCMGVISGCASNQDAEVFMQQPETLHDIIQEEEQDTEIISQEQEPQESEEVPQEQESQESYSPEQQLRRNKELFLEEAEKQGIDSRAANTYLQILTDDNLFQDGAMALTGIRIDDIDGNGQQDMLVMVTDAQEKSFYGSGSLWFYINEDEPYCFSEEDCSYYGWFDVFWEDIDNDENVEIVFSAQGTGCGAVGDSYKAVFKYKDHTIKQMELPSDFEEDYDCGLCVEIIQEPEPDSYSAYCPYLDEKISFQADNVEGWDLPRTAEAVGGNARGYYNLRAADYEGKKALFASEYLYGEGGTADFVGTAQFVIVWENGTPKVAKWWIEP